MVTKNIVCKSAVEAEGLKALLREEGIICESFDETNSKVARGVLDNSIEVMVKEEDYDRAMEIYQGQLEEQNMFRPWCPQCGSEDVVLLSDAKVNKKRLPMFLAAAMTFLPLGGGLNEEEYRCNACGKKFSR